MKRTILLFSLVLAACSGSEAPTPAASITPPPSATPAEATPATDPKTLGPRVPPSATSRMAGSHILIAYAGSVGALPNISRTKAEAKARAEEVRTKLLAGGDFASLARAYSDDSSASKGGNLGGFNKGVFVPEFEDAINKLQVNGISAVVETPFGYHVIRRDPVLEVHGAHMLVSWKGAERAPDSVKRSRDEAKTRAEEALAAIKAGKEWNDVVRQYSDGPAADAGGDLGWFTHGQLFEPLDSTAFNLDIGATSEILESPRGFHILRRLE